MSTIRQRYKDEKLCPVCGTATKGCSVTDNGLHHCRGTGDPGPEWVECYASDDWRGWRRVDDHSGPRCHRPRSSRLETSSSPLRPMIDWRPYAEEYAANATGKGLPKLAQSLDLPLAAVMLLPLVGVAEDEGGPHWTLPEVDAAGQIVGIKRRYPGGEKKLMSGGRHGLTVLDGWLDRSGPLLLPEGASDTIALAAAGLAAIGRPSKKHHQADAELGDLLATDWPADRLIVVMGESDQKPSGDWPGRDGAEHLARLLAERLRRTILIAYPPDGAKDVRAWLTARVAADVAWDEAGRRLAEHVERTAVPVSPPTDERDPFEVLAAREASSPSLEGPARPELLLKEKVPEEAIQVARPLPVEIEPPPRRPCPCRKRFAFKGNGESTRHIRLALNVGCGYWTCSVCRKRKRYAWQVHLLPLVHQDPRQLWTWSGPAAEWDRVKSHLKRSKKPFDYVAVRDPDGNLFVLIATEHKTDRLTPLEHDVAVTILADVLNRVLPCGTKHPITVSKAWRRAEEPGEFDFWGRMGQERDNAELASIAKAAGYKVEMDTVVDAQAGGNCEESILAELAEHQTDDALAFVWNVIPPTPSTSLPPQPATLQTFADVVAEIERDENPPPKPRGRRPRKPRVAPPPVVRLPRSFEVELAAQFADEWRPVLRLPADVPIPEYAARWRYSSADSWRPVGGGAA